MDMNNICTVTLNLSQDGMFSFRVHERIHCRRGDVLQGSSWSDTPGVLEKMFGRHLAALIRKRGTITIRLPLQRLDYGKCDSIV